MRESKLITDTKELEKKWVYPFDSSWYKHLFFWPQGANKEAHERIDAAIQSDSWRRQSSPTREQKETLKAENFAWVQRRNPELNFIHFESVYSSLEGNLYYTKNEYELFSYFALNEFLAQEEFDVYRDFLDSKWDELYKSMSRGHFNFYSHSPRIARATSLRSSLLHLRPRSAKAVKEAVENLNREQLTKLSKLSAKQLQTSPSALAAQIEELLSPPPEFLPPLSQLEASLYVSFSRAVANSGRTPNAPHVEVAKVFLKYLNRLSRSFYENKKDAKSGQVSTYELKKIVDILENNAEKFSPLFMLAIVFSLTSPDCMVAAPKLSGLQLFKEISKLPEESQVAALKLVAELTLAYKARIPSLGQWIKFLTDGSLEIAISLDLMFDLIGSPGELKSNVMSKDFMDFRSDMRSVSR